MGEIFLTQFTGAHGFDKLCVVKKVLPDLAQEPEFIARFIDEAQILVQLSHGNIAQVLDMGVHEGEPFLALEFVDGKDLRRVLSRMKERGLPLPLSFVLSVMIRVLDALAYAHRKRGEDGHELNLVHRDLSPQNVLISYEGEVKVIDFGLAKTSFSSSKTQPGIVMGKFKYLSPEQARHLEVDRRSDIYTVGLCLWELITGKSPFEDESPGELMVKVGYPEIPPLNTVEPLCPLALSEAVVQALALDPSERFQSAEEFRGRLQAILSTIDPRAGAETTSRFMRDAFAVEYQAERRMLKRIKAQAKLHAQRETSAPTPDTEKTYPMLEAVPSGEHAAPEGRPPTLSFQPTPRGPSASTLSEIHDSQTSPAILFDGGPTQSTQVVTKSFVSEETAQASQSLPSVIVDDPPAHLMLTMVDIVVPPSMSAPRQMARRNAAKAQAKKSAHHAFLPNTPKPELKHRAKAVVKGVAALGNASRTAKTRIRSNWVWLLLPALAVFGVGGYIAWDLWHSPSSQVQTNGSGAKPEK